MHDIKRRKYATDSLLRCNTYFIPLQAVASLIRNNTFGAQPAKNFTDRVLCMLMTYQLHKGLSRFE